MYANVEPSLDHSGLGRQTGREIYISRFARKPKRSNLQTFEHAKPSNLQIFKPSNLQTFKTFKHFGKGVGAKGLYHRGWPVRKGGWNFKSRSGLVQKAEDILDKGLRQPQQLTNLKIPKSKTQRSQTSKNRRLPTSAFWNVLLIGILLFVEITSLGWFLIFGLLEPVSEPDILVFLKHVFGLSEYWTFWMFGISM